MKSLQEHVGEELQSNVGFSSDPGLSFPCESLLKGTLVDAYSFWGHFEAGHVVELTNSQVVGYIESYVTEHPDMELVGGPQDDYLNYQEDGKNFTVAVSMSGGNSVSIGNYRVVSITVTQEDPES